MVVEPLTHTLLSLPRYARIAGVNPVHFWGAYGNTYWPLAGNRCNDIWVRYSWQRSDQVSHEDLANVIYEAEEDIARVLGFYPAPRWFANELHRTPTYYRPDWGATGNRNVRGIPKGIKANWKRFLAQGRRATTLIGTASTTAVPPTLSFLDLDSDGFTETARIVLPTTETNACEIKVYFAGQIADEGWEIRPIRSKVISGGNVTIDIDIWLLINPELYYYPTTSATTEPEVVNIDTTANYVTSVDVYREYTDTTTVSAQLIWENGITCACGGAGCEFCVLGTQDGCLHVRDMENSIVVPAPATYDTEELIWVGDEPAICRDPDMVKIWYQAGNLDDRFLRGISCEPLSQWWAMTIAMLASARLDRPFCSCGAASGWVDKMQVDLAHLGTDTSYQFSRTTKLLDNPFGTRYGEVQAWKRVANLGERLFDAAVI